MNDSRKADLEQRTRPFVGNEQKTLIIKDLSGVVLASLKPQASSLMALAGRMTIDIHSMAPEGWDAYLADDWIGSSEI